MLFIASSLLNKYPSDNAGHDHVSEFLNVVSHSDPLPTTTTDAKPSPAVTQYNKILLNQNKSGAEDMDPVDQLPVPEGPYEGTYGA